MGVNIQHRREVDGESEGPKLPAHELGILQALGEGPGCETAPFLLADLQSRSFLESLNAAMEHLYGAQLSVPEAKRAARSARRGWQSLIHHANAELTWHPEVRWPSILGPDGDPGAWDGDQPSERSSGLDEATMVGRIIEFTHFQLSDCFACQPYGIDSFFRCCPCMGVFSMNLYFKFI